jgi:hypothetical protein
VTTLPDCDDITRFDGIEFIITEFLLSPITLFPSTPFPMRQQLSPLFLLFAYLHLAEKVKEEMESDMMVGKTMMDHEKGLNNAFSITFENVNVVGCDFL